MKTDLLTRTTTTPEFRIEESRRLTWYATLFNDRTTVHEKDEGGQVVTYVEVIRAGAFTQSLKSQGEITANIDHDDRFMFAKRSDGSLLVQEDPKGLFCSCWVPEGELGDRIIADVKAGRLNGASFRFHPVESRTEGGKVERLAVRVADVCITNNPAYPSTIGEVHLRTADAVKRNRVKYLMSQYQLIKIRSRRAT